MFLLCALLGALYAFVLYRNDSKLAEFSTVLISFLAVLRGVLVCLLASLLLAPLILYQTKKIEKPKVIIAQDVSESILLNKDSLYYQDSLPLLLDGLRANLDDDFEVYHYFFDQDLRKADSFATYSGQITNFDVLFEGIEERYSNRNMGAVVLLSDGIYNQGSNPIYQLQSGNYPIYSVALGDTSFHLDFRVQDVAHNEVAYLGNDFPINIKVLAQKANGEKTNIKLIRNKKVIWENLVQASRENEVLEFQVNVEAKQTGVQRYEIVVEPLEKEQNTKNNVKSIYIDVLDGRQKILLLAEAPHPDIAAIKSALSKNKNYEVKSVLAKDFDGKVENYNLLILHQLPSKEFQIKNWLRKAEQEQISTFFILGKKNDLSSYNQEYTAISLTSKMTDFNEVLPLVNTAFPLFSLSEKQEKELKAYPPLLLPFGKYMLEPQSFTLMNQKIGNVNTETPFFAFREVDGQKTASFIGEGIWRWRLANFEAFKGHQSFDELFSKTVQYLALKADKSYFRINHTKQFLENEQIVIEAQLYNKSYELINEPEVNILIVDSEGVDYPYLFSRTDESYLLNLKSLPVGNYTYEAKTIHGGKEYKEIGEFSVAAIELEASQTIANHNLLFRLSEESNGALVFPNQIKDLSEQIKKRTDLSSISFHEDKIEEVIKLKWIFFCLLSLLSLEWFLRKRNGAY